MKYDKLDLAYHIDYIENIIHLLEMNSSNLFTSLVNSIGPDFQEEIVARECLLRDVIDFEWLIYCSNGLVLTYKDYNLNIVPKEEKRLHRPFLSLREGM